MAKLPTLHIVPERGRTSATINPGIESGTPAPCPGLIPSPTALGKRFFSPEPSHPLCPPCLLLSLQKGSLFSKRSSSRKPSFPV